MGVRTKQCYPSFYTISRREAPLSIFDKYKAKEWKEFTGLHYDSLMKYGYILNNYLCVPCTCFIYCSDINLLNDFSNLWINELNTFSIIFIIEIPV